MFSAGKAASPVAPDAWGATDTTQTTNSTNLLGTNNNLTILTGLYIEAAAPLPASSELPMLMRPFPVELNLCERYWEKSYDYATALNTNTNLGCAVCLAYTTTTITGMQFKNEKRAAPTMTIISKIGTAAKWSTIGDVDIATTTAASPSTKAIAAFVSSSLTAGVGYYGHFVADSRL